MEGIITLLTRRRQMTDEQKAIYEQNEDLNWADRVMLKSGQAILGQSDYVKRLRNSLIIASTSTLLSVTLGLLSAYAFSRFRIPGKGDLLFFILSTRMLPPVVVTIPIFLMYRQLGLYDTHGGLILLYTAFNLSFSVWLLKGFIDEIPKEYEEAALVDGYTRLQAFIRIVMPEAMTGSRRDNGLLLHLRLERIRLRAEAHRGQCAHRPAAHPVDDRHRDGRMGGDRRRLAVLPDPRS